jgi:hypothetical protein
MRIRNLTRPWLLLGAALLVGVLLAGVAMAQTSKPSAKAPLKQFKMVRSQSAAAVKGGKCLKGASADVRVTDAGQGNQNLYVTLNKAAKNTEFTVFLIQQPNSPFGVSWYQGDIATDNKGHGTGHFVGIFNSEVFAISPGAVARGAANAGCSKKITPFDGDHLAGIQALSTRNFRKGGPLGTIK